MFAITDEKALNIIEEYENTKRSMGLSSGCEKMGAKEQALLYMIVDIFKGDIQFRSIVSNLSLAYGQAIAEGKQLDIFFKISEGT